MNNNPILSIITPSFNQGKYISKTIESVINQVGDFYIDYIIMDGGSKDQSVDEIRKYEISIKNNIVAKVFGDIPFYKYGKCLGISYRWISEKDNGQSDALNRGFQQSIGLISTWLNSDDYYVSEDIFQSVMQNINLLDEKSIIMGYTIAIDSNNDEIFRQRPRQTSIFTILYKQEAPQQPSIFFHNSFLKKVGFLDESLRYVMDIDLWIRFLLADGKFKLLKKFMAYQLYHSESKSMETGVLCKAFEPEDRLIKVKYKKMLGLKHYIYSLRFLLINKTLRFIFKQINKWKQNE